MDKSTKNMAMFNSYVNVCQRLLITINHYQSLSITTGWWFEPLWKKNMKVNWDDNRNPILMGKCQIDGNQSPPTRYVSCHPKSTKHSTVVIPVRLPRLPRLPRCWISFHQGFAPIWGHLLGIDVPSEMNPQELDDVKHNGTSIPSPATCFFISFFGRLISSSL